MTTLPHTFNWPKKITGPYLIHHEKCVFLPLGGIPRNGNTYLLFLRGMG
jgi:hypothetical protein